MPIDLQTWRARIGTYNAGSLPAIRKRYGLPKTHIDGLERLGVHTSTSASGCGTILFGVVMIDLLLLLYDVLRRRVGLSGVFRAIRVRCGGGSKGVSSMKVYVVNSSCSAATLLVLQLGVVVALSALLLLAGDVERNPGPNGEHCLTKDDLPVLMKKIVSDVQADWELLGVQLQFKSGVLKGIREDVPGNSTRALQELLTQWLRRGNPSPTLEALAEAIGGPVIRNGRLADSLLERKTDFPSIRAGKKGNLQPEVLNVEFGEPLNPDSPAAAQELGDKCVTRRLDKEIRGHYAGFVHELSKLLTQKAITVNDLLLVWPLLDDNRVVTSDLREAKSVTSLLLALLHNHTWYNYSDFKFFATHFGKKDGEKLVASYEKQLKDHVKKRVLRRKIPKKAGMLVVKLNWQRYTEQDIVDFRNTLAWALKRDAEEFVLKFVGDGCIELVFVVPADLCDHIKGAVKELTTDLKKNRAMTVTVNGECIWSESGSGSRADSKTEAPHRARTTPTSKRLPIRSGARGSLVYRSVPPERTKSESRLHSPLVVLVSMVVSVLFLAAGVGVLLWAGLKPYATDNHYDIILGSLCLVLGCIGCSYSPRLRWKRKHVCRWCLCGVLCIMLYGLLYYLFTSTILIDMYTS